MISKDVAVNRNDFNTRRWRRWLWPAALAVGTLFFLALAVVRPEGRLVSLLAAAILGTGLWRLLAASKQPEAATAPPQIQALADEQALQRAVAGRIALLYKHSTICGASSRALREVERFIAGHPAVPVYMIRVIEQRRLSNAIAERFGIVHQSPQAILLRDGKAVWSASHGQITADQLAAQLDAGGS